MLKVCWSLALSIQCPISTGSIGWPVCLQLLHVLAVLWCSWVWMDCGGGTPWVGWRLLIFHRAIAACVGMNRDLKGVRRGKQGVQEGVGEVLMLGVCQGVRSV